MRQSRTAVLCILSLLISILALGTVSAQETPPSPEPTAESTATATPAPTTAQQTYVVQAGDNLFRIALRFGTTYQALASENGIANPRLIYVGQTLRIPSTSTTTPAPTTPAPATATPVPSGNTYAVQRGESLGRIAARYNTTVAAILAVNPNITNPNIVYVGQVINLPSTDGTTVQPQTTEQAPAQATPAVDTPSNVVETLPADSFGYGIEIFIDGQPIPEVVQRIDELDVQWVKIVVSWRELEQTQGQIVYGNLDSAVSALDSAGVKIMLTLTNAPAWARDSQDENGPPRDLADFTTFVTAIATKYKGVVDAYEIWNEPNLRRNWNCNRRMCDTDYVELLRGASQALTTVDDDAIVISAGLAPTRFNDRVNAINDRVYFESLLARGGKDLVDAFGVHPGGWANPPDAECCEQPIGVSTHYEDEVFYFSDNIEAYRALLVKYNASDRALWVTKFGWGTSEDTAPPSQINIFVSYTSLTEQAIYVPRAFEIGDSLNYV
ncbi:MAG: LysM peptidoglycan-binding domain-containing protein, partial [Anaerolineae bacterium]|nr:LysM peptidoglycan-binding domain-containing protein [Anaerolineae bacterium]